MKREKLRKWGILGFSLAVVLIFAGFYFWENRNIHTALARVNEDAIKFSVDSGVYGDSIKLRLEKDFELPIGPEIWYSIGGNNPKKDGIKYENEIVLNKKEGRLAVYPVNAVVCINKECGNIYQRTYVIDSDYVGRFGIDLISVTSSQDNLYDYETGILVPGKTYDENKKTSNGNYIKGNYNNRGDDWVRDAKIARFSKNGELVWEQDIGLAVSGMTSAALTPKSLKIVANYKKDAKLTMNYYEAGEKSKTSMVTEYNSLRLRSGSQDESRGNIRSAITSRLAKESGFDGYTETSRAVVYLNGEFYGIYDVQQNYSDSFLANKFSLPNSDKVEKHKGSERAVFAEGGITDLFNADLNERINQERLEEKVDMENYLRYIAIEILLGNTDWPQNSFEMWRYTGEKKNSSIYTDGKWRFLLYDMDLIYYSYPQEFFEGVREDILVSIMENRYRGKDSVIRNVLNSELYRGRFIEIIEELLGDVFSTENVLKIIDEEAKKIEKAEWAERWKESWEDSIKNLRTKAAMRESELREVFREYFQYELDLSKEPVRKKSSVLEGLVIAEMAPKGGSDWMKFVNVGKEDINLGDYYISDSKKQLQKYELPKIVLGPNEKVVINGKHNFYLRGEYICNFNLSEGETLYLSKNGKIVDSMMVPRMDKYETVGKDLLTGEQVFYYNKDEGRKSVN